MKTKFAIELIKAIGWRWIIIIALFWTGITQTIQRFKCPEMTSTQLFLATIDCALFNFKECN